jgi:hypothetical protein
LTAGAVTLRRGMPERLFVHATLSASHTVLVGTLALEDGHGGRWRARLNGATDRGTITCLVAAGGSEKALGTMEYG